MTPEGTEAAKARLLANHDQIVRAMVAQEKGNPLAAEPSAERLQRRLQTKAHLSLDDAARAERSIRKAAERQGVAPGTVIDPAEAANMNAARRSGGGDGREAVWGDSIDFVNVSFLAQGARTARAVGRVAFDNGRAQGTGFLIGAGLFLTNHHVIGFPDEAPQFVLEFDYERDVHGSLRQPTRFRIDPSLFLTDGDGKDGLDYSLFSVGERLDGSGVLTDYGFVGLSDANDKHMLGECVNIIQHPAGRFKEVVLRENRLVGRHPFALHYVADTEPGSSGSPVFNSEWQAVALHHWGSPWREAFGADAQPLAVDVNEGIRISAIVAHLRGRLATLEPEMRARVERALAMGAEVRYEAEAGTSVAAAPLLSTGPRIEPDGRVTFTIPLELSVRLPGFGPAASAQTPQPAGGTSTDAAAPGTEAGAAKLIAALQKRDGYDPAFLPGFPVPLPRLSPEQALQAAPNLAAKAGEHPHELRYRHYSVVMNGERRLAFFTACNIDGATAKLVNRKTKAVRPLTVADLDGESLGDIGAEAEDWADDPRILASQQTGTSIYEKQKVAGFPNPQEPGRIARMFQKGHLVRRIDPAWGDKATALEGEQDSFFYTNAAPQVGFFNQGTAPATLPASAGGDLWRAVEDAVLRNAVAGPTRMTSFTGPILTAQDLPFRAIRVPTRFFKIAVWVDGGALKSLAMIADQAVVIETLPEAFDDAELQKVKDFLTTIAKVEADSGLDFGEAVRAADVRRGQPDSESLAAGALPLA